VAAAVAAMPALAAHKNGNTDEVLTLLKGIHAKAASVEDHAQEMQKLIEGDGSWQSHATNLQEIKADVNDMAHKFARLEEIRDSGTAEERAEIDRVQPMLKALAANTTAAIKYLADNQKDFWLPAYMEHVNTLVNTSDQLYTSLGHVVQFEQVTAKEKRLEKTLETGM
jgi:hypothetical protein